MKRFKLILRIIIAIFALPALAIHELSHFIIALFVLKKPLSIHININGLKYPLSGLVEFKVYENTFPYFIINIAPLITIIIVSFLAIYFSLFIYILIYQLFAFPWSFPSNIDINRILTFFGYKKESNLNRYTKLWSWLYYDGLTMQEYDDKTEKEWLDGIA